MRRLKTFILVFSTLCCIALGAALPYLTLRLQEPRAGGLLQREELSAIDLALHEGDNVGPAMLILAKEHIESLWDGETVLAKEDACEAARGVAEELESQGLLPKGELGDVKAETRLLVAGDGSSALVWACTWPESPGTYITLDDATGKAASIMAETSPMEIPEDVYIVMEKWKNFLQGYYDIQLASIKENGPLFDSGLSGSFILSFTQKDSTKDYEFKLDISDVCTLLNYW